MRHNQRMLRFGYAGSGFAGAFGKTNSPSPCWPMGPLRAFYSIVLLALALIMA